MMLGNIALIAATLVSSYVFARIIFRIIGQAQQKTLRSNQELSTLNEITLAVTESLDLNVVMHRALDKLLEITGASSGEILLKDDRIGEMVLRVHTGLPEGFFDKPRFGIGEGFVGAVAEAGRLMVVEDVSQERWMLGARARAMGLNCLAGVPLKSEDSVMGVIVLAGLRPMHFTQDDTRLLISMSNQVAVAIENARLHGRVKGMAALEERERIAREMHDGFAQVLTYVDTKAQAARRHLATGRQAQAEAFLEELERVARDSYADVREAILGLRSRDLLQTGLEKPLKEYILRFNQLSGVRTELENKGGDIDSIPESTGMQVLRIIQECLTNVRRHARATHAWVRITGRPGQVEFVIEDDGQGFEVGAAPREAGHFGLQTMKERAESVAGSFRIDSEPGNGARAILVVPTVRGRKRESIAS